jgi:epoxyqueuosine reductase
LLQENIRIKAKELNLKEIRFLPVQTFPIWEEGILVRKKLKPTTSNYWESIRLTGNVEEIMENANTIIVAINPYKPFHQIFPEGYGKYSAHYEAYPKGRAAIIKLGRILTEQGYNAIIDPPLPAKQIAYKAGLGLFGKNGLLYHPTYGSYITIHTIITDAAFKYDGIEPEGISDCGNCRLCIENCPMQAIGDRGIVYADKCLRYYMFSSAAIPIKAREKMGMRMLGCEDCQFLCPKNKNIIKHPILTEKNQLIFNISEILKLSFTGLKKHCESIGSVIGKNYAKPTKILSMAIIAAGNSGNISYIPLLKQLMNHPNPTIRDYSSWAINMLEGKF